jgi:hypothetical protein
VTRDYGLCDMCDRPARLYPCGGRCDQHSPATLAGHVVPTPDPARGLKSIRAAAGRPDAPSPIATSSLFDRRAVLSGKSRRGVKTYAAMKAAEDQR